MQYNTQRPTLIMPEYGRGIQDMVEMAIGLPTKIERERCARAIVSIMARIQPQQSGQADYEQKLWNHLARISRYQMDIDYPVEIVSEDIPGWLLSNEGNLTVALEVEVSDQLRQEGLARELVNRIQNLRKDSGLEITDRISVTISHHPETDEAVAAYDSYMKGQVLADRITIEENDGTEVDFDDFKLNIKVETI